MLMTSSESEYFPDTQKLKFWETISMDDSHIEKNILPDWFSDWYMKLSSEKSKVLYVIEWLLADNDLPEAIKCYDLYSNYQSGNCNTATLHLNGTKH